ncbi:hypothetical protein L5515_008720 [Caenorhabditis briggsae]|uniref:non-specific serine/threonine protein kinase n=2 Tax=Caenorhabditis briggsae TaxID=6238 RepID=A0AAE9JM16_CAEBR|nr:hypothetical protein L5515_008720 [Caenorhabditis briggsae]
MKINNKLQDLIGRARKCVSNEKPRETIQDFLKCVDSLINETFLSSDDHRLDEDAFIEKLTFLEYITYSLSLVTEKHRLTPEETFDLFRSVVTAICVNKDQELARSFDDILTILLSASTKLHEAEYETMLTNLLEVVKYCDPEPSCSTSLPRLITAKSVARIETNSDGFFKLHLSQNIFASVFGEESQNFTYSDVFLDFWPHCLSRLKVRRTPEEVWIMENCLRSALVMLKMKRKRSSVLEQAHFINELFSTFNAIHVFKNEVEEGLTAIFEEIQNFFQQNDQKILVHKDLRAMSLEWLNVYINFVEETFDDFGLLDYFSFFLVDLTAHQDLHEIPLKICGAPIELCIVRIQRAVQTSNIECLQCYLDIVASLFKLAKIQKNDSFQWFVVEIQKHNSIDNPHWPSLLRCLLSVQHPICQSFCKQFVPPVDTLWMKLKNGGESSRNTVNLLATILGSCTFLGNSDERVKQIIPLLLIPCLRDFRDRVGTKWDAFRIIVGQRNGLPESLIDLQRFASVLEANNSESAKLAAVQCALQIEKKTGKYINLVAEMALAVFSKSQSDKIAQCLPALFHFLGDNQQFVSEFITVLVEKLSEKYTVYNQETLSEIFTALQKLICMTSNGKNPCRKCIQQRFVEPDSKENAKIDEKQLAVLISGMISNKNHYSDNIIKDLLQTCRVILLHVDSKKLIPAFNPVIKAIDLAFSVNADTYFRIWELVHWKSTLTNERKQHIYVKLFMQGFLNPANVSLNKLNDFLDNVSKAKLSKDLKATVCAALFSHAVFVNNEYDWNLVSNRIHQFAFKIVRNLSDTSEEELLQAMFKRYSTIFIRSFLQRLFHEAAEKNFEEIKIRETTRLFVSQIIIIFKFPNAMSVISDIRSSLLYRSLMFGTRGTNPKSVCSVIDLINQELSIVNPSPSCTPRNPTDMRVVMEQQKTLITEFFPKIVQLWTLEEFEKKDLLWKFCADHCNFKEDDLKVVTSSFRKKIFENLLLTSPQQFCNRERSLITIQLQKIYESMKKGEKFMISTAMDTRNEGIEFIFAFRSYFTNDDHFLLRETAAKSFGTVLQNLKSDFFHANWWAILMTLRQSPLHLAATRQSWVIFIEEINLETLLSHIWRILAYVSRVSSNEDIIEHLWNRLGSVREDMTKLFWIIPVEVEKNFLNMSIATSRRIEDVFDFIKMFPRYPSLQFIDNLSSKIDRGTVCKNDLPKLLCALAGILPMCQTTKQRNQLISILQKTPITYSELADHDFIRWDPSFKLFSEPRQLTQAVLEECAEVVMNMSETSKIDYADRTMCEIYRFFNQNTASEEMKLEIDGIVNMYSKMSSHKPEPVMIEQKTIDELSSNNESKTESFARWLTVLILKCAEMAEDAPLASLISISHIDDTNFLSKIAMRFILTVLQMERDSVAQWILTTFEDALMNATQRKLTKSDRGPASFIFYVFDFLYIYNNSEEVLRQKEMREKVITFWKSMISWTTKDDHGHNQPLIVRVAESFGMEKRCILWLEMFMDLKKIDLKKKAAESQECATIENRAAGVESAYYFTLMNLYARIHELNGVRGAYAMLSKTQIDHVYGKICIREAFGELHSAASFAEMTGKGRRFNAEEMIRKLIEEQNSLEYCPIEKKEQDEYVKSLKTLTQWVSIDDDIGPSPHVFSRTIENRSTESVILSMIRNEEREEVIDEAIQNAKSKIVDRLSECALGGLCSYETSVPFVTELQKLDEIVELKNARKEDLIGFDSEFWKNLNRRTNDGEQSISVLEPILRVRRSLLDIRMQSMGDKEKDNVRSRIVDSHLQSARLARLAGCLERAQLSIINAKKVLPFENKIVLEEAKLRLHTSDELNGMSLLDSIIAKNFGEIQATYSHTQQSVNLDVQKSAKLRIELFPVETKNLFSSVQMLRISHMIKSGNTVGFEKLFDETKQLIELFARSGVMYEAVWFMDYLSNYNERSKPILALLKAYREVAKYEKNQVLQARAVERMTSLWLANSRKINDAIATTKMPDGQINELKQTIKSTNREMQLSLDNIGWRAFYPAYAVLARHIDHKDDEVARMIKHIMKQLILRMPHQCMWQSVYLLRQNIADIKDKYMEVLAEVKRKSPCYVTIIDQYDYASGIFNLISTKIDSNDCKLSEKVEGLKILFRDKKYDPKELEMNRRLDGDCKVLNGIMIPIRSVIDESVHATDISDLSFEESCHLPDRYLIHNFSEQVKVLHSNTKPVLIELTTMTGRKVRLICKKTDDLTKDYHFNKIVEMCNDLLMKDEQTKIQNMAATTFSVIPLAKQGGIIEFIEGVTPYFDTLESVMQLKNDWSGKLKKWKDEMSKLKSKEARAEYFRDVACKQTPVVMAKWFRLQYPEAGKWFASRKTFAKSTAVMSIIGYIFGLGDRHTKNLMIHLQTGKCIHVDFDMIFNKGETLGTPELVPFRLTQNMINGMGEVALDGEFRAVCEQTLRVFRENSYEIEKYISDLPNLVADFANNKLAPKDFDMTEAKRLVSGRIRGQIMTVKLHKSRAITYPMQVSQLASSLIDLATSDEKLCEMFPGWMPTL